MTLQDLLDPVLDASWKGYPHHAAPLRRSAIAAQGWNVLRGDLPLPALVLKESALEHNIALMAEWCEERGILHAPHGKTTMAPQLFSRQLDAGAWGVTAATVSQARMYRAFGVQRILLANELVEPGSLRWLVDELAAAPELDFYCLVDSVHQVEAMAAALPVVSTCLPTGVPWVNQHGVTGLVVPPGDAAALGRALNRLSGSETLRRSLGEAASRRADRLFSRERMVQAFHGVVEAVVHAPDRLDDYLARVRIA